MMKHMYGIVMGLFMLTLVSVAYVSADDSVSSSSTTGSVTTGTNTGKLADLKREHKAEKMELFDSIRENWTATVSENASGTKAFVQAATQVRKAAFASCKALVDQIASGSLTKESALEQCKQIKEQMNETIKAMRAELQAARKAAREATKTTNQDMRKTLKEEQKSEVKELKEKRKEDKCKPIGSGDVVGTGVVGSGTMVCKSLKPKEEIKTQKKSFKEELKERKELAKQKRKEQKLEDNNKDDEKENEVERHDESNDDDNNSGTGSATETTTLPVV